MNTAVKTAKTARETALTQRWISTMLAHVPEYLCEAAGLGTFMLSACIFGVFLNHPGSSVNQTIGNPLLRRVLGGVAMGLTAICIFRSPFGKRSGAHINPAVTTSFWLLGKIRTPDAIGYVVSQFAGAVAGVISQISSSACPCGTQRSTTQSLCQGREDRGSRSRPKLSSPS